MVLTTTANPANYTITYNKNTTDTVSNLPSAQTGTVSANAVTLSSNTPTRTGYTFLGWSEDASATTASLASGASVYMNQTQSNASITLYAVWKINTYTVTFNVASSSNGYGTVDKTTLTVNYGSAVSSSSNMITVADTIATATAANQTAQYSYAFSSWTNGCGTSVITACTITANFKKLPYMQDIADYVDSMVLEQQYQMVDKRDGKIYWVAKLADGNIWMTQNLDYDIKATGNIISNNDGTTSTWSPSTATSTTIFNSTTATDTYSYDYGDKYMPNGTDAQANIDCSLADNENCHYYMGNLYQFNAATAGSGGTNKRVEASSSICPAGWRLPISNSYTDNYSFGKLTNAYGITNGADGTTDAAMLASPLYFIRTGSLDGGTLTANGNYGNYWTSTTSSTAAGAYDLYIRSTYTRVNSTGYRYQAYAVRCVAIMDPTLNDISTMQEMTPSIVAKTPENASKQLIDTRDNKLYWVTKLKDGNIWMTQNLDYDIVAGDNIVSNNDGTTSIWNTSSTYAPQATLTGTAFTSHFKSSDGDTSTYSYDPGNYYWNGTTWLSNSNNTQGYSTSDLSTAFSTTAPADGGTHYHVGNLYQYNAATAGTGGTFISKDATSSICPKGWRLPTSNSTTANYSFGKLKNAYNATTGTALAGSPLRFVLEGFLYSGKLYSAGYYGNYWSSMTGSNSSYAYNLYFGSGHINPSVSYNRYYGFPVRCVAL